MLNKIQKTYEDKKLITHDSLNACDVIGLTDQEIMLLESIRRYNINTGQR